MACLKSGACDLLFLPLDDRAAERRRLLDADLSVHYTLLVPAGSSLRTVADADRPGVRIAAVRNHASTNELRRQLKQAQLVYSEFQTLHSTCWHRRSRRNGIRPQYASDVFYPPARFTGAGGSLRGEHQPDRGSEGQAEWLAYISEFVEEAKASGFVQQAIDRVGPRGAAVAPRRFKIDCGSGLVSPQSVVGSRTAAVAMRIGKVPVVKGAPDSVLRGQDRQEVTRLGH